MKRFGSRLIAAVAATLFAVTSTAFVPMRPLVDADTISVMESMSPPTGSDCPVVPFDDLPGVISHPPVPEWAETSCWTIYLIRLADERQKYDFAIKMCETVWYNDPVEYCRCVRKVMNIVADNTIDDLNEFLDCIAAGPPYPVVE